MDPAGDNDNSTTTAPQTYSLTLKGEGMAVDRQIDEATALDVLNLVMAGGGGSTLQVDDSTRIRHRVPRPNRGAKQSLREYLDEVEPKRNPDKILAIAKYTTRVTGKTTFTRGEVKSRFQDASERVPGNYKRDFLWAVRVGWIAHSLETPGEYYVTDKGDDALKEKFSLEVRKKTGVGRGRRGGKRKVATKKERLA